MSRTPPRKSPSSVRRAIPPEVARRRLIMGNQRFVSGRPSHGRDITEARLNAAGLQPYAVVVTCVDARVIPEALFDTGFGDIFVVRTAGHVLDRAVVGSVEFTVAELGVPLVVVLGHAACAAVRVAVDTIVSGAEPASHLGHLVAEIAPSVAATPDEPDGGPLAIHERVARQHTLRVAAELRALPAVHPVAAAGAVEVAPARYDVVDGQVTFLNSHNIA